LVIGFVCCAIAAFFFGTNFLPVKKYPTGDGMQFQWMMGVGIWVVGLIVGIISKYINSDPVFPPIALIGGVLWTTGNMLCAPIINLIGMGLGLLIWGGVNMIVGWAVGAFGLFGTNKNEVDYPALNYIGVLFALFSMGILFFIKSGSDAEQPPPQSERLLDQPSSGVDMDIDNGRSARTASDAPQANLNKDTWIDTLPPKQKRILGFVLAIVAGCFFGVNFVPPQWIIDNNHGSGNSIDYVFSHFCGIFLTSTIYFLSYCAIKKNKPWINSELFVPGFLSGIMWAIAQTAWFIANEELQFVISFPIIATCPGIVGSLWGVFLYKEIQGTRNYILLCSAITVTLVGVTFIALSKLL